MRARPGLGPGQVAWTRAPEGRADFPLIPRGLLTPYSFLESIAAADFSQQLQLSNSSVNN